MSRPEISIVIPFKDEEKRLPNSLLEVLTFADKHLKSFEIILVDDGSEDRSQEVIKNYLKDERVKLFVHLKNKGKGAAVRTGVFSSLGKTILFSDADLATPIREVSKLLKAVAKSRCDIAIGSRALSESVIAKRQPLFRVFIGKVGNIFVRLVTGLPYKDTQCGFKLFESAAAKELFREQQFPRWSFDIEILYKAKLRGYKVCEVPIEWRDVPGTKVKLLDPFRVLIDVLKIRRAVKK